MQREPAASIPPAIGVLWRTPGVRPLRCAFSPDGARLACVEGYGSYNQRREALVVLDAETGERLQAFGMAEFGMRRPDVLAWSPDGTRIAALTNTLPEPDAAATARGAVYEVATGALVRPLDPGDTPGALEAVAFSGDGARVAAVAVPTVLWWTVGSDEPAERVTLDLSDYGGEVVALSPGAERLATGRDEVVLWDPATGKRQQTLFSEPPNDDLPDAADVAFSPDGRRLAASLLDYTVLAWDLNGAGPMALTNLAPEGLPQSDRGETALSFPRADRLAVYVPGLTQVRLLDVSQGRDMLSFDAPRALGSSGVLAWHGDRFLVASLSPAPATLRVLCRGAEPCGIGEGVTPETLEALLPEAPAGFERAMVHGVWTDTGPEASAVYLRSREEGYELEIAQVSEAERQTLQQEIEAAWEQDGIVVSTQPYRGRTLHHITAEGENSVLVLSAGPFQVWVEGNVGLDRLEAALDAVDLTALDRLAARAP